jgi:SAM-dependent methyltransferase
VGVSAPFECRLCRASVPEPVVDLGDLPLANAFVDPAAEDAPDGPRFPVALVMCAACRLLQLREPAPRSHLFDEYLWTTGTSSTAIAHSTALAGHVAALRPRSFLVEVASNDGTFLRAFAAAGLDVLGVEPSNLADEATAAGLPSLRSYFDGHAAARIVEEHGAAQVIVARNVIGHTDDLRGLLEGIDRLLAPDGVLVVESPYALLLSAQLQYDTIFHEHVSYFTLATLTAALRTIGLEIVDLDVVGLNGGSFLCTATRGGTPATRGPLALEEQLLLNEPAGWWDYAARVEQQRTGLLEAIDAIQAGGGHLVGYGAAAKTMTMLNYCGIGPDRIHQFADANPRKQGLLCPGVRIPVASWADVVASGPSHVLVGPWNLQTEIVASLRAGGFTGDFVVPLPVPRVLPTMGG